MKLIDKKVKQGREDADLVIRQLFRYLPLTVFLTLGILYLLFMFSIEPEIFEKHGFFNTHGQWVYGIFLSFVVVSWMSIIYKFKEDIKFRKVARVIIFLAYLPMIYAVTKDIEIVSIGLIMISFYWLKFAFQKDSKSNSI